MSRNNNCLTLSGAMQLQISCADDPCGAYAASELKRMLGRLESKVLVQPAHKKEASGKCWIVLSAKGAETLEPKGKAFDHKGIRDDGYRLSVTEKHVTVCALCAKGLLNGVYGIARELGFAFLRPGLDGEWLPLRRGLGELRLAIGSRLCNPKFKYRGIFWGGMSKDYSLDEWMEFYAKLGFNALGDHTSKGSCLEKAAQLGIRAEFGGHGYRDLLPREMFAKRPELFRMAQPEDFGGKRVADFNSCAANPESRAIMRGNYVKHVAKHKGNYAVHLWPDDLPGGGWCLCPTCRSLPPSDQAMVAMRNLSRAAREAGITMKVPVLAYHDTMRGPRNIEPAEEMFLLFAPRERCYGHSLDDKTCERNKFYLRALKEWSEAFKNREDAHTFEYYFDQLLFRGLHPFVPEVVRGDMEVYAKHGIESYMVLQICGECVGVEWGMVHLSHLLWGGEGTITALLDSFEGAMSKAERGVLRGYLAERAVAYTSAMRMCGHDVSVYMDYRWLPESSDEFTAEMVKAYAESSKRLLTAVEALVSRLEAVPEPSDAFRDLVQREELCSRFESAELAVMEAQQMASHLYARHLSGDDEADVRNGVEWAGKTIERLKKARSLALESGLSEDCWYLKNINGWLSRELAAKAATMSPS